MTTDFKKIALNVQASFTEETKKIELTLEDVIQEAKNIFGFADEDFEIEKLTLNLCQIKESFGSNKRYYTFANDNAFYNQQTDTIGDVEFKAILSFEIHYIQDGEDEFETFEVEVSAE